jgi:hypothetical protein
MNSVVLSLIQLLYKLHYVIIVLFGFPANNSYNNSRISLGWTNYV